MQLLRFLLFYLFLNQFLSDLDENYIKFSLNRDLHDYNYEPVRTGLIGSVFIGFHRFSEIENKKNRTDSPVLQRFSPVQFAVLTGPKDRTFKHY